MFNFKMFVLCIVQIVLLQGLVTSTPLDLHSPGNVSSAQVNSSRDEKIIPTLIKIDSLTNNTMKPSGAVNLEDGSVVEVDTNPSTQSSRPISNTHYGREGELVDSDKIYKVTSPTVNNSINVTKAATSMKLQAAVSTTEISIPVSETTSSLSDIQVPEIHRKIHKRPNATEDIDFKKILSELNFSSTVSPMTSKTKATTTQIPTTPKTRPKKPTVTVGSDDDELETLKKSNSKSTPKVPTIEQYEENKEHGNKSAFIIPIVAVILSVPLVAIVMNVLYKRGKEWWAHRHYSRMDFLIDGMYNN